MISEPHPEVTIFRVKEGEGRWSLWAANKRDAERDLDGVTNPVLAVMPLGIAVGDSAPEGPEAWVEEGWLHIRKGLLPRFEDVN